MEPLRAEISSVPLPEDSRGHRRRRLRLSVSISSSEPWSEALIHDLSETGLLIETAASLTVGESVGLDLPGAEGVEARVIWKSGTRHGCEFLAPISKGAVSIALLQATTYSFAPSSPEAVEELPVGKNPSVEELAAWKAEFEKNQDYSGSRLVGFRVAPDGLLIALIAKSD